MTHKIYEAALDETGQVVLMEPVVCSRLTRALVIVLEGEEPSSDSPLEPLCPIAASR